MMFQSRFRPAPPPSSLPTLAPTPNYGAGPGYYGQTIPNTGTPIIPYTPSPDASINYTNDPYQGLDMDSEFMAAVAEQLGQIGQGRSGGGRRGGGGGGGRAGKFGASGIKPAQPVKAGLDVKGVAPNPGFYLNLPREQKYRYSGGL